LGYVSEGPGTFVAFAFKALGMKRFGAEALPKKKWHRLGYCQERVFRRSLGFPAAAEFR
jgi:hypothetical protein